MTICTRLVLLSAINETNSNYYGVVTKLLWWLNAKRLFKQLGREGVHAFRRRWRGGPMLIWYSALIVLTSE